MIRWLLKSKLFGFCVFSYFPESSLDIDIQPYCIVVRKMLDMILITFKFVAISLWPVMIFPKECSFADEKHVSSATVEQNVLWALLLPSGPRFNLISRGFVLFLIWVI